MSAAGAIATRDFRYQGSSIVEEKLTDAAHPSGAVVRSYVVDDAGATVKLVIPAPEPDAGTYLPTWSGHGDALALWRQNADGTLTLANSFTYATWGRPSIATHNGIAELGFRFLYVGEFDVQWDDAFGLGLTYMHARHYSPSLGRFLQPDPDRSEANLYAYTANNPVTELDPDGTCLILCILLIPLAVGAVIDTVTYALTTENPTLEGALGEVAGGAAMSLLPVGKLAKIGKVVNAASRLLALVPKAGRAAAAAARQATARVVSSGARSALEVPFKHPNVMRYLSSNVGQRIGELAGWTIRGSARGVGERTGLGLRIMEGARDGINFTGRQLRWHPGGGHQGPRPYWRVLQPNAPRVQVYQ